MVVSTATSGPESIDICREKQFDIIFMDHMMGGMDGVEAMKKIRGDVTGLDNNVPIVALTANAMSSAKQMFLSEGFDGFVSKPIEIEELERVLKQVLPKSLLSFEYEDEEGNSYIGEEEKEETKEAIIKEPEKKTLAEKLEGSKIDVEAGLKYCLGDEEFYNTLLIQFANEASEKIPALMDFYEQKDWGNYEIIVHALKSTSKMIGAMELSEEALKLEKAAKEKKESYIFDNHDHVMSVYEVLKEKINQATDNSSGSESESEVLEFKPEDGKDKSSDDVLEFAPMEEE
jgi:CheY-like chemotaxis protein